MSEAYSLRAARSTRPWEATVVGGARSMLRVTLVLSLALLAGLLIVPNARASVCERFDPGAIVGTSGDDVLHGTPHADVIIAGAGDDTVDGGGGGDIICGGRGADTLRGSDGKDLLIGRRGPDRLFGSVGDDLLF